MTAVLVIYGLAILGLAVVVVGIVYRLLAMETVRVQRAEPTPPTPSSVAPKIDDSHTHHLVILVDDSCSICHRTLERLDSLTDDDLTRALESVTVLASTDSFRSDRVPVVVDAAAHRALHPGWAPAGLMFSAKGLVEVLPVGSPAAIEHTLHRLDVLSTA